ncbi:Protein of unknown function [Micromonospora lupini str. Lupac 08]|uniref:Uncharacterized protein n=1 Tax=Micromonospora lupini str. Lupac 08 TaxID=1150864 RepID=I0L6J4_9ACTN|nr:Protein of unknown function [Micromonospora lupini str. Lupac 08]
MAAICWFVNRGGSAAAGLLSIPVVAIKVAAMTAAPRIVDIHVLLVLN